MPISSAARVCTPPVASSASLMRVRSSSRSSSARGRKRRGSGAEDAEGAADGDAEPRPAMQSGRLQGSTTAPSSVAAAYSMAFLSSRTLPGKG